MDLAALQSELQADPTTLGYATQLAAGRMGACADLLNAVRAGIAVSRGVIPGYEIVNALDPAEAAGLSSLQLTRLMMVTSASGGVDTGAANTRTLLANLFAANSATRAALVALATRSGSRAEQLFGAGTVVRHEDVSRALGRG